MTGTQHGRLFCFGLGFTGIALARALRAEGWSVGGTVRSQEKCEAVRREGIDAHVFDGGKATGELLTSLAMTSAIVVSVPPGDEGDPVFNAFSDTIKSMEGLKWLGYLSTTGVYGNRDGGWVDETSPREPTGQRGRRRVEAEDVWLGLHSEHGVPVHLFRLAGIYGPGRNAVETVRQGRGQRIDKPGQVFSRIHRDDIVNVLKASMAAPNPGAAYNVCDDDPAPPGDVIAHAYELLGMEPPPPIPFDEAELSPMARSFYQDNKRVSNDRIKKELGIELAYPGYRDALPDFI